MDKLRAETFEKIGHYLSHRASGDSAMRELVRMLRAAIEVYETRWGVK